MSNIKRKTNTSYVVSIVVDHFGSEEEQNQNIEMIKDQITTDFFEEISETSRFVLTNIISIVELAESRNDGTNLDDKLFA